MRREGKTYTLQLFHQILRLAFCPDVFLYDFYQQLLLYAEVLHDLLLHKGSELVDDRIIHKLPFHVPSPEPIFVVGDLLGKLPLGLIALLVSQCGRRG